MPAKLGERKQHCQSSGDLSHGTSSAPLAGFVFLVNGLVTLASLKSHGDNRETQSEELLSFQNEDKRENT